MFCTMFQIKQDFILYYAHQILNVLANFEVSISLNQLSKEN